MLYKLFLVASLAWVGSCDLSGWYSVEDTDPNEQQRVAVCICTAGNYYWALHERVDDTDWAVSAVGSGEPSEDGYSFTNADVKGKGKGGKDSLDHVVLMFELDDDGVSVVVDDYEATFTSDGDTSFELTVGDDYLFDLKRKGSDIPADAECWMPYGGDVIEQPYMLRSEDPDWDGANEYSYFGSRRNQCWGLYKDNSQGWTAIGEYDVRSRDEYFDGKRAGVNFFDYSVASDDVCYSGPEIQTQVDEDTVLISWQCSDGSTPGVTTYTMNVLDEAEWPFEFDGTCLFE